MNKDIQLEKAGCCFCNIADSEKYLSLADHLYDVSGTYSIVRCVNCGHIYLNPRPTQEAVSLLYEKYYATKQAGTDFASNMRKSIFLRRIYHALTGEFLAEIISRSSGRVLDIGCGQGSLLDDLRSKGCESYGVEINPIQVGKAREKGLNVFCGSLDQAGFAEDFFDCIILNHVLEHLPDPVATLRKVRSMLKPEGKVFINCPNLESYSASIFGQYWAGLHIPFHFNHFTAGSVRRLAEICGFDIISMRTATPGYRFLTSFETLNKNEKTGLSPLLFKVLFLDRIIPKLILSILLRIPDFLFPGRGECIYVEMKRKAGE